MYLVTIFYVARVYYRIEDFWTWVKWVFDNYLSIAGIGIPLGVFAGIFLVGLEPLLRAILGSKAKKLIDGFLLSSILFDPKYFYSRHLGTIERDLTCALSNASKSLELLGLEKGLLVSAEAEYHVTDFESRLWVRLKPQYKRLIESRAQFYSMFFSISFVSLMAFLFQGFFVAYGHNPCMYALFLGEIDLFRQSLDPARLLHALLALARVALEVLRRPDSYVLLSFVGANAGFNLFFRLIPTLWRKLRRRAGTRIRRPFVSLWSLGRTLWTYAIATGLTILLTYILGKYLYKHMRFWEMSDFLVLYVMFLSHVLSYYAGCLEYDRVNQYKKYLLQLGLPSILSPA